jgi:hypothetical protein
MHSLLPLLSPSVFPSQSPPLKLNTSAPPPRNSKLSNLAHSQQDPMPVVHTAMGTATSMQTCILSGCPRSCTPRDTRAPASHPRTRRITPSPPLLNAPSSSCFFEHLSGGHIDSTTTASLAATRQPLPSKPITHMRAVTTLSPYDCPGRRPMSFPSVEHLTGIHDDSMTTTPYAAPWQELPSKTFSHVCRRLPAVLAANGEVVSLCTARS